MWRVGRGTSSPPQLGQTPRIRSAQATQNEHSKLQIHAGPSSVRAAPHCSQTLRISSATARPPQGLSRAFKAAAISSCPQPCGIFFFFAFCSRATASGRPSSPSRRAAKVRAVQSELSSHAP